MLVGYARVSTDEQNNELQWDALQGAGCERIYTEKASGAQRHRPQLQEALAYMREGDILVVWKLDRLARSLKQLIETVEDLEHRGMGFQSLTETIDTSSSSGKLVFHLFGSLSEFERSMIRERTMAGLRSARSRGRLGGRPRCVNASDLNAARAMLQDPAITVAEVAKRLHVSVATLYRYLPGGRSEVTDG